MATQKLDQRSTALRILAAPGWISGRLHMPMKARLLDFLDHAGAFLSLTEVHMNHGEGALPYVALQRSAICAVVPPLGESESTGVETSPHQIAIVMPCATVRGQLRTLPGVRVSDFLMHHRGFVRVENAQVKVGGHAESLGVVLVNCEKVIGVAEMEPIRA